MFPASLDHVQFKLVSEQPGWGNWEDRARTHEFSPREGKETAGECWSERAEEEAPYQSHALGHPCVLTLDDCHREHPGQLPTVSTQSRDTNQSPTI